MPKKPASVFGRNTTRRAALLQPASASPAPADVFPRQAPCSFLLVLFTILGFPSLCTYFNVLLFSTVKPNALAFKSEKFADVPVKSKEPFLFFFLDSCIIIQTSVAITAVLQRTHKTRSALRLRGARRRTPSASHPLPSLPGAFLAFLPPSTEATGSPAPTSRPGPAFPGGLGTHSSVPNPAGPAARSRPSRSPQPGHGAPLSPSRPFASHPAAPATP